MNQKNALDYIQHIKDFAAGKQMQCKTNGMWVNFATGSTPSWRHPADCYRVKPEPKLRPWNGPDEVPMIAIFKSSYGIQSLACRATNDGIVFAVSSGFSSVQSYETVLNDWVYSEDNRKTWKPCGVFE